MFLGPRLSRNGARYDPPSTRQRVVSRSIPITTAAALTSVDMSTGTFVRRRHKPMSREYVWGYLFVLPALLLAITFKIYPLVFGIYDSTRRWEGASNVSHYIGLANYHTMLTRSDVRESFTNALKILLTLPIWVAMPLIIAFLIFQRTPGWRFFRAVYFLPYIVAPVIVGSIFRILLDSSGPLDTLLQRIGLGFLAVSWLGNTHTALWTLDAVVFWSFSGLGVIIYLAGFATIPEDILEAAAIDGAGFWSQLFAIVLPLMRPVMGYWAVLCTGGMFLWMFPFIHAMTQGGPGYATMLPEYLVYITAFQFLERGYATAIGIVLFIFVLLFSLLQVRQMYLAGVGRDRV